MKQADHEIFDFRLSIFDWKLPIGNTPKAEGIFVLDKGRNFGYNPEKLS